MLIDTCAMPSSAEGCGDAALAGTTTTACSGGLFGGFRRRGSLEPAASEEAHDAGASEQPGHTHDLKDGAIRGEDPVKACLQRTHARDCSARKSVNAAGRVLGTACGVGTAWIGSGLSGARLIAIELAALIVRTVLKRSEDPVRSSGRTWDAPRSFAAAILPVTAGSSLLVYPVGGTSTHPLHPVRAKVAGQRKLVRAARERCRQRDNLTAC